MTHQYGSKLYGKANFNPEDGVGGILKCSWAGQADQDIHNWLDFNYKPVKSTARVMRKNPKGALYTSGTYGKAEFRIPGKGAIFCNSSGRTSQEIHNYLRIKPSKLRMASRRRATRTRRLREGRLHHRRTMKKRGEMADALKGQIRRAAAAARTATQRAASQRRAAFAAAERAKAAAKRAAGILVARGVPRVRPLAVSPSLVKRLPRPLGTGHAKQAAVRLRAKLRAAEATARSAVKSAPSGSSVVGDVEHSARALITAVGTEAAKAAKKGTAAVTTAIEGAAKRATETADMIGTNVANSATAAMKGLTRTLKGWSQQLTPIRTTPESLHEEDEEDEEAGAGAGMAVAVVGGGRRRGGRRRHRVTRRRYRGKRRGRRRSRYRRRK